MKVVVFGPVHVSLVSEDGTFQALTEVEEELSNNVKREEDWVRKLMKHEAQDAK